MPLEIIERYKKKDARIVSIHFADKQDLPTLRNHGIKMSNGKYIAKMDADDISLPTRLERQVKVLQHNSEVIVVGTQIEYFSQTQIFRDYLQVEPDQIKSKLIFGMSLVHATALIRGEVLKQANIGYAQNYEVAEDYDLWVRLSSKGLFYNLSEVLYRVRQNTGSISRRKSGLMKKNTQLIQQQQLISLGIAPTPQELELHYICTRTGFVPSINSLQNLSNWLLKLHQHNQTKQIYPEPAFTQLLTKIWGKHTAGQTRLGRQFFRIIAQNPLSAYHQWNRWQKLKCWLKCLTKQ